MIQSIKVGDVYRAAQRGTGMNYTVIRVTDTSYTYTTSTSINTVRLGDKHPFPEPYFYKVYGV